MNTLTIRLTKGRDSRSVLTCTRPDGSTTWSKVSDYFPTHDLAHYAVETTLGISRGFYGLILEGWDITILCGGRSLTRSSLQCGGVYATC